MVTMRRRLILAVLLTAPALLALATWRAPEAPAVALHAIAPRLTLAAAQTPAGPVKLTWTWTGDAPPAELTLLRAIHPDGLVPEREDRHPTARWTLAGARAGSFTDPAPADGVAYLYQAIAGGARSQVATVGTAPRPLPAVRHPRLRVDKGTFVMTLLDGERVVRRFPIALGRAPARRKLHFDNASTPEGVYRVIGLQPRATFHKAFDIDYPNALDRARYAVASSGQADFPAIGGEIQIHAGGGTEANWTFGCMAMRDADIDALFARGAVRVGTEVRIWGGELSEAQVDALAAPPGPAAIARWRAALAAKGHPAAGGWGPALWTAIGRYQRAEGLPVTCWPDAVTGRHLGLGAATPAASRGGSRDATVQDGSWRTIAHITRDGGDWRLQDASWRTVGHATRSGSDWRITDAAWRTVGHLTRDGDDWRVQDGSWRTVGHLTRDGDGWRVQDGSWRTIGHVDKSGRAQNASYSTIAHLGDADPVRAALVYDFFPFEWKP